MLIITMAVLATHIFVVSLVIITTTTINKTVPITGQPPAYKQSLKGKRRTCLAFVSTVAADRQAAAQAAADGFSHDFAVCKPAVSSEAILQTSPNLPS